MKTILALDLGTKCGFAFHDGHKIISGTKNFAPTRWESQGSRFKKFTDFLDEVRAKACLHGLGHVYYEAVERHIGTYAHQVYGGFWGSLIGWCEGKVESTGVPVGTIKKHITGKGNADKLSVIKAVQALGYNPKDDNEADAIALLEYAMQQEGIICNRKAK